MVAVGILSAEDVMDAHQRVQIVDARSSSRFDVGHIPGAISLEWEEWCDSPPLSTAATLREKGYWGVLRQASADWYAQRLTDCGLNSRDPIVVYANGPRSRGREGRIAWMLTYLGAGDVMLLDGGWQAWLDVGGETERGRPSPPRGHFTVSFQAQRRYTLVQLTSRLRTRPSPLMVDTRSAAESAGAMQEYLPRCGHIPGDVLVPFSTLFDGRGRYIDRESYREKIAPCLQQRDEIVAYCEVGVRASLFALLHEAYTGRHVSVFDGSIVEWALNPELPLQIGGSPEISVSGVYRSGI